MTVHCAVVLLPGASFLYSALCHLRRSFQEFFKIPVQEAIFFALCRRHHNKDRAHRRPRLLQHFRPRHRVGREHRPRAEPPSEQQHPQGRASPARFEILKEFSLSLSAIYRSFL